MIPKRWALALLPVTTFVLGGWTHGIATTTTIFKGSNWHQIIDQVPCNDVSKSGDGFQISGTVMIGETSHQDPVITDQGQVNLLEKKCFPKH
ncbi:hypothetical protein [Bradyrhizobium sp. Ash2021]|uniref:hypothetical protein n=1 Tax=Bradyrhizobium sp. Ash2021 TaxID=2954771 RepID=UPI0028165D6D|nr:hypothetical protein [Bradyrhizobium sp. Ash2021]WMT78844.1 hypothetical protein NL528_21960 [Bradyrhizobium sp. Ash2021]